MDIVDAQIHFNRLGTVEAGLAGMDALGIAAILYDEFTHVDRDGHVQPGQLLANGTFRSLCPEAEAASLRYPDRIGVLRRLSHSDPDLEEIIKLTAAAPYTKALRVVLTNNAEVDAFSKNEFSRLFAIAGRYDLPVAVLAMGRVDLIKPYLAQFPDLRFVIDHCGVPLIPGGQAPHLDAALELARFQNATLKWCHAPLVFSTSRYPFEDVLPLLARALDAFGPERIMWASDCTESRPLSISWAETLFYLRDAATLSESDKEWILGRTARKVFRWPATATSPAPA